jgi:hypothetical protein
METFSVCPPVERIARVNMRKNLIAKAAPGGFVLVSFVFGCKRSALKKYCSRLAAAKRPAS